MDWERINIQATMIINSEQLSKILHDRIRAGINEQDESYQAIELLESQLFPFWKQLIPAAKINEIWLIC